MSYYPPDYVDNTQQKLYQVLASLILEGSQRELDVASGFFEPDVWRLLGEALSQLKAFRLLLGRPPELENSNPDHGIIDLRQFYRRKLQSNLEEMPLNRAYAEQIDQLIAFLQQEHVAVNYYNGAFLHAKAYLMERFGIVGSSNFTPSGMLREAELNLVQQNQAVVRDLRQNWFERMWQDSADNKDELIQALEQSKFGTAPWTPHDVFIKVLYEYFKDRITPDSYDARLGVELASFQQEGLREAIRLLDRHGGVIVSDAVGLGKTYIGMSLLEHYIFGKRRKGHILRGLVVCPAQLRDLVWNPKLNEFGIKADVLSQEAISRESFNWKEYNNYDVVLIDESHNFRNLGTNRYNNLMKLLATGNPETQVILMTATPVNNSIWDLYNQTSFITRGQDAFFREYGIRNLKGFFKEVSDGGADIFTLLEQIMVRRSRVDVKKRQEAGEEIRLPGKGIIHFPERQLHSVRYDLADSYDGIYEAIVEKIESLALISFNIEAYRREEQVDEDVKKIRQYSDALIGLLKTLYLKRLESSMTAFRVSIERQQEFQRRFYDFLVNKERLLDSATNRRLLALQIEEDDTSSDELQAVIDSLPTVDIDDYNIGSIRRELKDDMQALDKILNMLKLIETQEDEAKRDAKLHEVKKLLGEELRDQKILIFSYYHDTAIYLINALRGDTSWQQGWSRPPVMEAVHGSVDGHRREEFVKRFAPKSNSSPDNPSPITHELPEIDILVSTDVLSEGQNLQDAGVIINYDLHWTPIRMIQRAGRIDRLGTDYELLHIYNCFPQQGLETLLGLVQRLQDRIRAIDTSVGLDASILGEAISARSLDQLRRLSQEDVGLLDELEREIELVSTDEMKLPLIVHLQQMGMERIQSIPKGIGSGIQKTLHRPSGIFFAFQAGDRHFWRLYTIDNEVISDKRRLYRYLSVPPNEKRQLPPRFEVFDYLEMATDDVLKEINKALRSSRIKPKLGTINKELEAALRQASLFAEGETNSSEISQEIREKVQHLVEDVSLDAFKKDKRLKEIRDAYKRNNNQVALIMDLHLFFIDNDLYRDAPLPKSTLDHLREEDLELIAYEVFN